MKVAVYCGTRNLYNDMIPAANSLLVHSDVDKIYFLIEDDEFPYEIDDKIECLNVSNQTYFTPDGPNFNSSWTYMVLIRAALSKIFPQYDTILSLDVDTIVNENISDLWDIDISDYYLAACKEPEKSNNNFMYINMGVALFNLKKMRDDQMDDKIIKALNTKFYKYNEQDCISELCQNHIYKLNPQYNVCNYTETINANHRSIIHFAAIKNWNTWPQINKYRNKPNQKNIKDKIGLDIIIPTYKNIKGLIRTLDSIKDSIFPKNIPIVVTVIDDCSNIDYSSIMMKYPFIKLLTLNKNSGPGVARQYGINNTSQPYLMFIDTDDYLFDNLSLTKIINKIKENSVPYIYNWQWYNEETGTFSGENNMLMHGTIYQRDFLEMYNITFCKESSYSNEDIGFNHTCTIILNNIKLYDNTQYRLFIKEPIYYYIYDVNSITHINNKEFLYTKHISGLITNIKHTLKIGEQNNLNKKILWEEICAIMIRLYYDYSYILQTKPEYAPQALQLIKDFYLNYYKLYEQDDYTILRVVMTHYVKHFMKLKVKHINIFNFLKELDD